MTGGAIHTLDVCNVSKRFGYTRALKNVQLSFEKGSVSLVVGPNGAGKSTLLGVLSTLVRPNEGEIHFRTKPGESIPNREVRQHIGVLAHTSFIYGGLSGRENLHFYASLYGLDDVAAVVREALRGVALDDRVHDRMAKTYSRGMMQRLSLARALIHNPDVLLLDEPFTGLDREGCDTLAQVLRDSKEQGRLVILVTHDFLAVADIADRLIVLGKGKVVADERAIEGPAFRSEEIQGIYQRHTDGGGAP